MKTSASESNAKCIDRKNLENSKHNRDAAVPPKTGSIAFEVVHFPEWRSWHEGVAHL